MGMDTGLNRVPISPCSARIGGQLYNKRESSAQVSLSSFSAELSEKIVHNYTIDGPSTEIDEKIIEIKKEAEKFQKENVVYLEASVQNVKNSANEQNDIVPIKEPENLVQQQKTQSNISGFLKGEASVSLEDDSFSAYNGVGMKYSGEYGAVEGFVAGKVTDDTQGYFLEGKYTTPKIMDTNLTGEARARVFTNWDKDGGEPAHSVNFRGSIGYSTNYEDWSLYARAGVSATTSLHGDGLQTIAPTVIGGVGYNITQDFNMHLEADISRGYDCQEQKWKHPTKPTITFGFKIEL